MHFFCVVENDHVDQTKRCASCSLLALDTQHVQGKNPQWNIVWITSRMDDFKGVFVIFRAQKPNLGSLNLVVWHTCAPVELCTFSQTASKY